MPGLPLSRGRDSGPGGEGRTSRAPRSALRRAIAPLLRNGLVVAGLVIVVLMLLTALLAPLLAPRDPIAQDIANRLAPPSWQWLPAPARRRAGRRRARCRSTCATRSRSTLPSRRLAPPRVPLPSWPGGEHRG